MMVLNLEVLSKDVESIAQHAEVPVWNGLTNEWHPTQMIADFIL